MWFWWKEVFLNFWFDSKIWDIFLGLIDDKYGKICWCYENKYKFECESLFIYEFI